MSESVRTVDRALDILECFTSQTPELSLTQISERINIHKSTVHRLLATLETRHFLQRDRLNGGYRLGIRALQMAYLTLESNDLRQIAHDRMQTLSEKTKENVHLSIMDGSDIIYLDIIESPAG